MAYGGLTGRVAIFDVATGDVVKTLTPPPATTDHDFIDPAIAPVYVGPLAFSPDGTKLVSAALETATLFDLGSGQQLAQLTGWDLLATNAYLHARRPIRGDLRLSEPDAGVRFDHRRAGG